MGAVPSQYYVKEGYGLFCGTTYQLYEFTGAIDEDENYTYRLVQPDDNGFWLFKTEQAAWDKADELEALK